MRRLTKKEARAAFDRAINTQAKLKAFRRMVIEDDVEANWDGAGDLRQFMLDAYLNGQKPILTTRKELFEDAFDALDVTPNGAKVPMVNEEEWLVHVGAMKRKDEEEAQ